MSEEEWPGYLSLTATRMGSRCYEQMVGTSKEDRV